MGSKGVICFSTGFRRVDERFSNPMLDGITPKCGQNLVNYPKVSLESFYLLLNVLLFPMF